VLFLFLLVLAVLSSPSPVFASVGYWNVNVLVAYDEEWQSTAQWVYAYSARELADIIISDVRDCFYRQFSIRFWAVSYVFWDSYDSPADADEMMDEVIRETGFHSGMSIGNYVAHVLVAFTDQDIPDCYGYSDKSLGVVLVEETYSTYVGQATDNILQHELSHLYHALDHSQKGLDCVMNGYPVEVGFQYFVPTALTTNNWCSDCVDIINNHKSYWGEHDESSGGGGGGGTLWWNRFWMCKQ